MKTIFFIAFILSFAVSAAAVVDTVYIPSPAMHKDFKCVVIRPDDYKKNKTSFPVLYLLHGFSGDFSNWIKKCPN